MNLKQFMVRRDSERGKFDRITNPPSTHRDLCAMLILSKFMAHHNTCVINCAVSDDTCNLVFEPSIHDVETLATEQQVIDLIRCGVSYSREYDALIMEI